MNIKDEYFSRIIYQKNAVENLSGILKADFQSKKVFFISSKTAYQKFGTAVANEFNRAGCEFIFKFFDGNEDKQQIEAAAKEGENCKIVVSLGGGSVIDTGKFLAKTLNAPHIVIVSNPTTTAAFSNFCFVNDKNVIKKIDCNYAHKILIDEVMILKASSQSVNGAKEFLLSFWEVYFNLQVSSLLFGEKKQISGLLMVLAKLQDNNLYSNENQGLLVMDMLIDLGFYLKDINTPYQTALSLALMLKNSGAIVAHFGKLCLVSASMLLSSYKKFFSLKKLDTYSFLNFESLASSLKILNIDAQSVTFNEVKSVRNNKQLFLKLNAIRNQVLALIEKCENEIESNQNQKIKTFFDIKKCLSVFEVLPYVQNCSPLTNVLSSTGLIVS